MSLHRWNAKRDATEPGIVKALRKAGSEIIRLDAFDLLVLYRRQLFMLDAKSPGGQATLAQEKLIAAGWPLHYVTDELAALRVIGAIREAV